MSDESRLTPGEIQKLRRLTTPTIFNGWELITKRNPARECFNLEPIHDFTPEQGIIAGFAVTVVVQVGGPRRDDNRDAWAALRHQLASIAGPKILVVQDLDKPKVYGSIFGEVAAATFRSLGCVGAIIDGGVRDINEIRSGGFKVLGRQPCVGHGVGTLVRSQCDVEVFGVRVSAGQLIHADQHGFLAIPKEDETHLLRAATFLDGVEAPLLQAARNVNGEDTRTFADSFDHAIDAFIDEVKHFTERRGEW
jgi:regulator of RNase E activity RraA